MLKAGLSLIYVGKNLPLTQIYMFRERYMCVMSNIKANINNMKEMNGCRFVVFQAKTTLMIFKWKKYVWVNNKWDSHSYFLSDIC